MIVSGWLLCLSKKAALGGGVVARWESYHMSKNAILGIVAVVLLFASGLYLTSYYKSQPAPGATVPHLAPVGCAECGKVYITMLGDQPAKCYYCGADAVWRAVKCAKCGTIYPLVDFAGSPGKPPATCPKCGSQAAQEVPPDGLERH